MPPKGAYYNEIDLTAAAWLRELIKEGLIADGEVDTRSITEVRPADVSGFTQAHFFAGIGGWSYALRLAGWLDDQPVWTGSCPCQSFSAAGKQQGIDDPRHLWPVWADLIRQCRPPVVFGEQVEAAVRHGWLDLVSRDLEAEGYACGAVVLGAHSVGAPHLRQRLWFVAESERRAAERQRLDVGATSRSLEGAAQEWQRVWDDTRDGVATGDVADRPRDGWREERADSRGIAEGNGPEGRTAGLESGGDLSQLADDDDDARRGARGASEAGDGCNAARLESARLRVVGDALGVAKRSGLEGLAGDGGHGDESGRVGAGSDGSTAEAGADDGLAEPEHAERWPLHLDREDGRDRPDSGRAEAHGESGTRSEVCTPWDTVEWLPCRDGKWRPTQPGLFPLAHGVSGRVGRLRGYGNAINPWVAAEVIAAYLETR